MKDMPKNVNPSQGIDKSKKKTYELDRVLDWVEPLKTFPDTYVLATSVQRCAEVCFFLKIWPNIKVDSGRMDERIEIRVCNSPSNSNHFVFIQEMN